MDTEELQMREWFESISVKEWSELAEEADHIHGLKNNERQFVSKIAEQSERGPTPTVRQLSYVYSIVQKIESLRERSIGTNYTKGKPGKELRTKDSIMHLTVRMAWHSNGWNGSICNIPENNEYCIGEHSLLSKRIREGRDLEIETEFSGKKCDTCHSKNYQPPCYWSINALGDSTIECYHEHPIEVNAKKLKEDLPPFSLFTWPFKMFFSRNDDERKVNGKYPPNQEELAKRFFNKFSENCTIVFLYCNYDNPISGDEAKYLLVGCALLKGMGKFTHFQISQTKMREWRSKENYQNFSNFNWSYRISCDFPNMGVTIPYHSYLQHAEKTNNFDFLNDMKVVIDERELEQGFKYVAMNIDDDQAIYLLTKLRKSLFKIGEQGIVTDFNYKSELTKLDNILNLCWRKRGYFPGFGKLARIFLDRNESDNLYLDKLINAQFIKSNPDDVWTGLITDPDSLSTEFDDCNDELLELRDVIEAKGLTAEEFLRLAALNLTFKQFTRIVRPNMGLELPELKEICHNPYTLCEDYKLQDRDPIEDQSTGDIIDGEIPLFRIDIAFYPDIRFQKRLKSHRSMKSDDPRRIRALVISSLKSLENRGDCFESGINLSKKILEYPLFYKTEYIIRDGILINPNTDMKNHLNRKLVIENTNENGRFYYLKEVYDAEQYVEGAVKYLLECHDINKPPVISDGDSLGFLKNKLGVNFNEKHFLDERNRLYNSALKKRFYILSGGPGTGKSYELLKIITALRKSGEICLLLCPTGKATLRLNMNNEGFESVMAMTIDKFLNEIKRDPGSRRIVHNLIIDEFSMVDLMKFMDLLKTVNVRSNEFKRLILVGDEHQLPPIGFGRVLYDIVNYLKKNAKYETDNYIRLETNCRQEYDPNIIKYARVFSMQERNPDLLLNTLSKGGQVSEGMTIHYWSNREELRNMIMNVFIETFESSYNSKNPRLLLNRILGLEGDGSIKSKKDYRNSLKIDSFQVISPYRTSFFGALGINNFIQEIFKEDDGFIRGTYLKQGDKIIQLINKYHGNVLFLSNGSFGIAQQTGQYRKQYYFPEAEGPLSNLEDGSFELAFAITVHKSQGSGFDRVFFILPSKKALLSRELVYTALTRSKTEVAVFIQDTGTINDRRNRFYEIVNRSDVELRKTTLMEKYYWDFSLTPSPGVCVKSRAEYIIYKSLMQFTEQDNSITFEYEYPLEISAELSIKPDFTIETPKGTFYWEHLGRLSDYHYAKSWEERKILYEKRGLMDSLITTDELLGIHDNKIKMIISDIVNARLASDRNDEKYSLHHYQLVDHAKVN